MTGRNIRAVAPISEATARRKGRWLCGYRGLCEANHARNRRQNYGRPLAAVSSDFRKSQPVRPLTESLSAVKAGRYFLRALHRRARPRGGCRTGNDRLRFGYLACAMKTSCVFIALFRVSDRVRNNSPSRRNQRRNQSNDEHGPGESDT